MLHTDQSSKLEALLGTAEPDQFKIILSEILSLDKEFLQDVTVQHAIIAKGLETVGYEVEVDAEDYEDYDDSQLMPCAPMLYEQPFLSMITTLLHDHYESLDHAAIIKKTSDPKALLSIYKTTEMDIPAEAIAAFIDRDVSFEEVETLIFSSLGDSYTSSWEPWLEEGNINIEPYSDAELHSHLNDQASLTTIIDALSRSTSYKGKDWCNYLIDELEERKQYVPNSLTI